MDLKSRLLCCNWQQSMNRVVGTRESRGRLRFRQIWAVEFRDYNPELEKGERRKASAF